MRTKKKSRGVPAGSVLANGILGWRPPSQRQVRLEELMRLVGHHGEMCPCSPCNELRSL